MALGALVIETFGEIVDSAVRVGEDANAPALLVGSSVVEEKDMDFDATMMLKEQDLSELACPGVEECIFSIKVAPDETTSFEFAFGEL